MAAADPEKWREQLHRDLDELLDEPSRLVVGVVMIAEVTSMGRGELKIRGRLRRMAILLRELLRFLRGTSDGSGDAGDDMR